MKQTFWILASLLLTLMPGGNARAQVACGETIGPSDTPVALTGNLNCPGEAFDNAVTLRGPIKLQMRGRTIRCTGANDGVRLTGERAKLLGPGKIVNCDTAVTLSGDGFHTARRLTIISNQEGAPRGFDVFSSNNTIKLNVIRNVEDGILLFSSDSNKIRSNQIKRAANRGIRVSLADSGAMNVANAIIGNIVTAPGSFGIEATQGGKVKKNRIIRAGGDGVIVRSGATNVRMINNRITRPAVRGIVLDADTSDSVVRRNTVVNATGDGIVVVGGSSANVLIRNTASGSGDTDLVDENPGCDQNVWSENTFDTASRACIR